MKYTIPTAALAIVTLTFSAPAQTSEPDTRLQIFLDQQLFGPGKIDGRSGEFTRKALKAYQRAHGLPETGVPDRKIPLDSVHPLTISYVITSDDVKQITPGSAKLPAPKGSWKIVGIVTLPRGVKVTIQ